MPTFWSKNAYRTRSYMIAVVRNVVQAMLIFPSTNESTQAYSMQTWPCLLKMRSNMVTRWSCRSASCFDAHST